MGWIKNKLIKPLNYIKDKTLVWGIIKRPMQWVLYICLARALLLTYSDQIHLLESVHASWSNTEVPWLTRALNGDTLYLQLSDSLSGALLSNNIIVGEVCSGENIAKISIDEKTVNLEMLLNNKYILDPILNANLLERMPKQRKLFHFRNGQIGEAHCPLYAMKSAIYAASGWELDIDIYELGDALDFDYNTETWYAKIWNMAGLIEKYVGDCKHTTDWTIRPSDEYIDSILSRWWVVLLNVLSQWWYMHRVTILGQIDGKYIISNSWRTMFDAKKSRMKSVSPTKPFATYKISTWTTQLLPKEDIEYNIAHSFVGNIRANFLKNLSFGGISWAAIAVYPSSSPAETNQ